jgi:hypothetical protein
MLRHQKSNAFDALDAAIASIDQALKITHR